MYVTLCLEVQKHDEENNIEDKDVWWLHIVFGVPRGDIIHISKSRVNDWMFNIVYLLCGGCLVYWYNNLWFWFAGKQTHNIFASLNAFEPRVLSIWVIGGATVFEPITTGSATTDFTRFLDGAALRAYGPDCRHCCRRGCWCWDVDIGSKKRRDNRQAS